MYEKKCFNIFFSNKYSRKADEKKCGIASRNGQDLIESIVYLDNGGDILAGSLRRLGQLEEHSREEPGRARTSAIVDRS